MKKNLYILLVLSCFATHAMAQNNEPTVELKNTRKEGFLIGFSGQFPTLTGGDMKKRFGNIAQLGPSLSYKSASNWLTDLSYSILFGNKLNELVGKNLTNSFGQIVGTDGYFANVSSQMAGFTLLLKTGKIIAIDSKNPDSGILLMAGIGFMQHRINLKNNYATTPQISGNYLKGYDRLSNGMMLSQTIAIFRMDKKKLFNYQLGIELGEGFTKNRRNFNFDTQVEDNNLRIDFLAGLKFSIYIPAYLSAKDEYYYY